MKIRFTKEYTVRDIPPVTYEAGDELECNHASVNHFINRGVAEVIDDSDPVVVKKETIVEKKPSSASQPDQASQEPTVKKRRGRPRKSS